MTTILERIEKTKRTEIAKAKELKSEADIRVMAKDALPVRDFCGTLKNRISLGEFALIAELKKASPSKGLIRSEFNPCSLAKAYESGGADCLSVLTDLEYFKGCAEYLMEARSATSLPVLRKDFLYDPYQVYESRAWNADCILIIMAAVTDYEAKTLEETAFELDMSVILEVHDEVELNRAMRLDSPLLGINNRDLKTFETKLETCELLAKKCGADRLIVGESGISTNQDLIRLSRSNINAFLVGEHLMRQDDLEQATQQLLGRHGNP